MIEKCRDLDMIWSKNKTVCHPIAPEAAGRAKSRTVASRTHWPRISRPMRLNRPPPRLRPISPSGSGYFAARCPLHSALGSQYMHHTTSTTCTSPCPEQNIIRGKGKVTYSLPPPFHMARPMMLAVGRRLNRIRTVTQRHFAARLGLDGMMPAVIGCCCWSDGQMRCNQPVQYRAYGISSIASVADPKRQHSHHRLSLTPQRLMIVGARLGLG